MASTANSKKASTLTYLLKNHSKHIEKDSVVEVEEQVADGSRGISFKYFSRKDKDTVKYSGSQANGKFKFVKSVNKEKEFEKELSKADLIKELAKIKELAFVLTYLKSATQSGGYYRYQSRKKASKKKSTGRKKKSTGSKTAKKGKKKSTGRKRKASKKTSKKKASKKKSTGRKRKTAKKGKKSSGRKRRR